MSVDAGQNPANADPPAYHLFEALLYRLASGGDILDRYFLMLIGPPYAMAPWLGCGC